MKRKMVVHILNELHCSGMEKMLYASRAEWSKYDIESVIITTGSVEGPFAESLRGAGFKIVHIPFPGRRRVAFFEALRYFRSNTFYAVHVHTEGHFLLHVLAAYLSGNRNIIRTIHSIFKPRFLGRMRRRADRLAAHMLGVKFVSIGSAVHENERVHYFTRTKVCPNWYDDQVFKMPDESTRVSTRKTFGLSPRTFVIASVGNCQSVKRHELLIRGLALLPEDFDWHYLHVGAGEKENEELELVSRLGLEDHCSFFGRQEVIYPYLAASDLYAMVSMYEGFSIAALEALASGVFCLFSNVPGLRDFKAFFPGVLYADSTPKALADAIINARKMLEQGNSHLKQANAQKAVSHFSISQGVENYVSVYDE